MSFSNDEAVMSGGEIWLPLAHKALQLHTKVE